MRNRLRVGTEMALHVLAYSDAEIFKEHATEFEFRRFGTHDEHLDR